MLHHRTPPRRNAPEPPAGWDTFGFCFSDWQPPVIADSHVWVSNANFWTYASDQTYTNANGDTVRAGALFTNNITIDDQGYDDDAGRYNGRAVGARQSEQGGISFEWLVDVPPGSYSFSLCFSTSHTGGSNTAHIYRVEDGVRDASVFINCTWAVNGENFNNDLERTYNRGNEIDDFYANEASATRAFSGPVTTSLGISFWPPGGGSTRVDPCSITFYRN